jgi:DNA-binding MarR family transcriptional regulator
METTGAGPGADAGLEFCIRLSQAHAALTRRLDGMLAGLHGLSFSDFMILYHLERAPGGKLRRVDLAERLGLTASGVTRSLIPLEKLGLVSRQADPRDARVGYATLTSSGRQLLVHAMVSVQETAQNATGTIPTEQIEAVSALLARLTGTNMPNY